MAGDRVVWRVPTLHLIMAIAVHIQMPAQARLYATSRSRRTVESRGYAPHVTVFSMNRPEHHLHRDLFLDATGRPSSGISRIKPYDVWSAFTMLYNTGKSRYPPPLAPPHAQLPPFPQKSRRRITAKSPAGDLDEQVLFAAPPPTTRCSRAKGQNVLAPMPLE